MADRVETYEEKLRAAGEATAEVRDLLQQVVNSVDTAMSVGSAAWGPDKFGGKFADGDGGQEGFLASMDNMTGGTERSAESFGEMSKGQYDAADAIQSGEGGSTQNFQQL